MATEENAMDVPQSAPEEKVEETEPKKRGPEAQNAGEESAVTSDAPTKPTKQKSAIKLAAKRIVGEDVYEKGKAAAKAAQKTAAAVQEEASKLMNTALEKTNWITNTKRFKDVCDWVFDEVDLDKTGTVDAKELYAAVLLVYVYCGRVVPGGSYPPTPDDVTNLMEKVSPGQKCISKKQFVAVCKILLGNVIGRFLIQFLLALFLFPLVAQIIVTFYNCLYTPGLFSALCPDGLMSSILSTVLITAFMPKALNIIDIYFVGEKPKLKES